MVDRYTPANIGLAMAAVARLAQASIAIRRLPFARAVRLGSVQLARPPQNPADRVIRVVWAVRAASARVPWRTMCFPQALAAQLMLRRAGIDARLHFGAALEPDKGMEAHVWVTVDGQTVIGGEQAPRFGKLYTVP